MSTIIKQKLLLLSFVLFGGMAFAQSYTLSGIIDTSYYSNCDSIATLGFGVNNFTYTSGSDIDYMISANNITQGDSILFTVDWGDGTVSSYTGVYFASTIPLNFGPSGVSHVYTTTGASGFNITVTASNSNTAGNSVTNISWFSTSCPVQLYGFVDIDCDSNGVVDSTITSGVGIDLIHSNGSIQTFTLNNGFINIPNLATGNYSIAINPAWLGLSGYNTLYVQPANFFYQPGGSSVYTFQAMLVCDSVPAPADGCIWGQVFCDNNGNGVFDSTDYGVYNAPISITYDNQIFTQYTDPNGYYNQYATNGNGDTAVAAIDQNWLGQNGYQYGITSQTVVITPCQTTTPPTIVNFPVNCDSAQTQTECLYGFIFCDANGNGSLDSGEVGIPYAPVILSGNSGFSTTIYTNSNGYFSYSGPAYFGGVVIATVPTWWLTQHGYTLSNNIMTATTNCNNPTPLYFGINCSPTPCADLWTAVSPWIGYYQNSNNYIKLKWGNYGPSATTGFTLTLTYPSSVTPDLTSIANSNYLISGNTITWTFGPGSSYINQYDVIKFFVPSGYPSGTSHVYSSVITALGTTTDCDSLNNDGSLCMILGNSYDPNDKSVSHAPTIDPNVQDELTYVLRFQNTGTAPAQDVYIIDSLSSLLDWSTIKVISTSHNMQLVDLGNGVMKFNFPGIWLPDSTTNEALSHGDVVFSIKENANNGVGTTIENTGFIYFDWNPAIVTNTTTNTNAFLGLADVEVNEVSVSPNPFSGMVKVASSKRIDKVSVVDITGKVVFEADVNGFNTQLELNNLTQGMYLVRVFSGSEVSTERIVKK